MSDIKERRQGAIVDLICSYPLASQEQLVVELGKLGFVATQATISRDLEQIGALKSRRGGRVRYTLPEDFPSSAASASRPSAVIRDWVRSIDPAGTMLILKTPAGSAHLVGVALDASAIPEVVGTVSGDDTIFVACRTTSDVKAVAKRLKSIITGDPQS